MSKQNPVNNQQQFINIHGKTTLIYKLIFLAALNSKQRTSMFQGYLSQPDQHIVPLHQDPFM